MSLLLWVLGLGILSLGGAVCLSALTTGRGLVLEHHLGANSVAFAVVGSRFALLALRCSLLAHVLLAAAGRLHLARGQEAELLVEDLALLLEGAKPLA